MNETPDSRAFIRITRSIIFFNSTVTSAPAATSTSSSATSSGPLSQDQVLYKQVYTILYGYVLPMICICGFLGNVLNLVILTGSRVQRSLHRMERSSNTSLIALAIADLCFCFCAFPSSFLPQDNVYSSSGFMIHYGQFCAAIINMFIMTSTWLTVTMSSERFIAICYPLRSRRIISLQRTKIANICVYVFSVVINIPVLWRYTLEEKYSVGGSTTYYLNQRILFGNERIDHIYRATWAIVGNLIPLALLVIFNIRLTREIHKSYAMRRNMNEHATQDSSRRSRDQETSNRITLTLVTIVAMFFILVAPSEMLKHMVYLFDGSLANNFSYLTIEIVTNVMQSINFSANFMLYCILNPSFRRSIKSMLFRATSSTENHLHTGLVSGHVFERSRPASGYSLQITSRSSSLRTPHYMKTTLNSSYGGETHLNRHAHSMKTPSPTHNKINCHFV